MNKYIENIKVNDNVLTIRDKELTEKVNNLNYGRTIDMSLNDINKDFTIRLNGAMGTELSTKTLKLDFIDIQNNRLEKIESSLNKTMHYKGEIALSNLQSLDTSSLVIGDVYKISSDGVFSGLQIGAGDNIIYNGSGIWHKLGEINIKIEPVTVGNGNILIYQGNKIKGSFSMNQEENQTIVLDSIPSSIPKGIICMWSGAEANLPKGWALCDGRNGTPDLRNRFILGSDFLDAGTTGGRRELIIDKENLPPHSHKGETESSGSHVHSITILKAGEHAHILNVPNNITGDPKDATNTVNPRRATTDYDKEHRWYWRGTGAYGYTPVTNVSDSYKGIHSHQATCSDMDGSSPEHKHKFETSEVGSGKVIEIMPPYYKLAFIMKIESDEDNDSHDLCLKCLTDFDNDNYPIGTYALYTGRTTVRYIHGFIYEKVNYNTWNPSNVQNVIN